MISRARARAHASEVRPTAECGTGLPKSKDPHLAKATPSLWGLVTHPTGCRSDKPHLDWPLNLGRPRLDQFSTALGTYAPNS
jgi:hypothetical protein